MRILLAEDEKELSNAIVAVLKHNYYSVDAVYNGEDALDWALNDEYDLIILDVMMPKINGLDVLKGLRDKNIDVPVLILTAKGEIDDRVIGLDLGADDYMCKPFNIKEFLARVRAIIRRKQGIVSNNLEFNNMILNKENFELSYEDKSIRLGNKEYQILEMLMINPNVIISTEKFMSKVWGYDSEAEINGVWVYISYLRKKLISINSPVEIKAFRGIGYKLENKSEN
ncbi:Response regulator of D-alanyl-lipoteichoic acid biosynthesis [Candidatus Arthromitus sp. SFB-mouse-NL]|uniref:response regulator transcription factor n=1 Tax=Candidatus Arthromitus sp. SFB-mouse-NL TaxID=1508644 RepID=UPI00049A1B54|nr:response regulator transcription factor [Candidatus Arthromitus sp. SFB-mouse-NL]AID44309.1 Response regulator of D-alanyl-lipoteichoic acid biosynthesis [Candidatus Arthromitus sp. SFB-mouse-NL]